MKTQTLAYDICRYYISDNAALVNPILVEKVLGYNRARDIKGLATCTSLFDWAYHSIADWRFLRQIEAFFKKNADFVDPTQCGEAARTTFFACEAKCAATNLRLDFCYANRVSLAPDLVKQIETMQSYISDVLGDFDRFLTDLPRLIRITPGATASTRRADSVPPLKMKMKVFATAGAARYLKALYRYHGFNKPKIMLTDSNRVERVPKNWKTDRTIACEPEGNLPLQLAFDTYAKGRLAKNRINLRSQFKNQQLSREASINDNFVTVDGENASSTISYAAVAWLFPLQWFDYLNNVRTPRYRGCFGEGTYAMFSSMGNGSTFTIETLLFSAACYAAGSRKFLVYGDDVIIEKEFFEEYRRITEFLGFTINESKTFVSGPFRESCGLDSWNGVDVTPVYLRGSSLRKAELCHIYNVMKPLSHPEGKLLKYLNDIARYHQLPAVPFQDDTMSGIWIDPDIAKQKKLCIRKAHTCLLSGERHRNQFYHFKGYKPESKLNDFSGSQGYYLWFLRARDIVRYPEPWALTKSRIVTSGRKGADRLLITDNVSSAVATYEHRYVRKWVCWREPTQALPVSLYWDAPIIPPVRRVGRQRG